MDNLQMLHKSVFVLLYCITANSDETKNSPLEYVRHLEEIIHTEHM